MNDSSDSHYTGKKSFPLKRFLVNVKLSVDNLRFVDIDQGSFIYKMNGAPSKSIFGRVMTRF